MEFFTRVRQYLPFLKSLFQDNVRLIWGMWRLMKLPQPAITVFGGSRITGTSIYAHQASLVAKKLVSHGFSIITGGGPGIMEAANLGALEHFIECKLGQSQKCKPVVSAGIGLIRLNKERANPYVQEYIEMEHFFSRKWLLVRYAIGFVVFPGGFGTLDELFEIVTLVQTQRMNRLPIVLVGKRHWQPLMTWIENTILTAGLIEENDGAILQLVDDVDEAVAIIVGYCKDKMC